MFRSPHVFLKNGLFFKSIFFLIVIIFMSLTLSSCFLWPVQEELPKPPLVQPQEVALPLTVVVRGPIEDSAKGTAYYQPAVIDPVILNKQSGKVVKLHIKEGDRVNKGDLLLELDTGNLEDSLYYQRIAHERAQIAYDRLKERSDIEGGGYKYDLRLAELTLEVETKKLNELEETFAKTRIFAPVSGQVIFVRKLKTDEYIADGTTLCYVCDPESGILEYNNATNAGEFKIGTKVEVSYTKNKEKFEYECDVVGAPLTQPEDSNKKGVVFIDAGKLQNLEFGDRVSVKLVLKYNENAILVPKSVIRENQGEKFVYVYENGMRSQRLVEVGIMTATQAEITEGLQPGEQIFTR